MGEQGFCRLRDRVAEGSLGRIRVYRAKERGLARDVVANRSNHETECEQEATPHDKGWQHEWRLLRNRRNQYFNCQRQSGRGEHYSLIRTEARRNQALRKPQVKRTEVAVGSQNKESAEDHVHERPRNSIDLDRYPV